MSSLHLAVSAAASPLRSAALLTENPRLVNVADRNDLSNAAKVLLQAGQRQAINQLVLSDKVTPAVKATLALALAQHRRMH